VDLLFQTSSTTRRAKVSFSLTYKAAPDTIKITTILSRLQNFPTHIQEIIEAALAATLSLRLQAQYEKTKSFVTPELDEELRLLLLQRRIRRIQKRIAEARARAELYTSGTARHTNRLQRIEYLKERLSRAVTQLTPGDQRGEEPGVTQKEKPPLRGGYRVAGGTPVERQSRWTKKAHNKGLKQQDLKFMEMDLKSRQQALIGHMAYFIAHAQKNDVTIGTQSALLRFLPMNPLEVSPVWSVNPNYPPTPGRQFAHSAHPNTLWRLMEYGTGARATKDGIRKAGPTKVREGGGAWWFASQIILGHRPQNILRDEQNQRYTADQTPVLDRLARNLEMYFEARNLGSARTALASAETMIW